MGQLAGKRYFLLAITILVLAFLVYFYVRMLKLNKYKDLRILFIFVFSGAAGNMIDRIRLGYVIDMFDFRLINFPVFNVADIYVTCSMIILLVLSCSNTRIMNWTIYLESQRKIQSRNNIWKLIILKQMKTGKANGLIKV